MHKGIQLGMYALILSIAACSRNGAEPSANESLSSGQSPGQTNGNEGLTMVDGITSDEQISAAVADLANRTGTQPKAITVAQARAVHWGSSAMGCPEEGKSYTEAIVPGVQLLLDANGVIYHYHGRAGKSLSYCPDEQVKAPAYGPGQEIM